LIEFLVVTAVIGILMTMLLPSLKRTMHKGVQVHCKNNVKSISLAIGVYQHDYASKFPNGIPLTPGAFGYWDFTIGKPVQELLVDYFTDPKSSFICPSDETPEDYWYWRFRDHPNYDKVASGSSYMFSEQGILGVQYWLKEELNANNIRNPSTYGYMVDGRAFPNGWNWANADTTKTGSRIDWNHMEMVNFLFGDLHVESVYENDSKNVRSDPR
jgi:prepilin-type processing-associated H-X9-DG protein